jgi:phospholipid/cholesterol/gamma-HCH transport system ATP-binding protein
MSAIQVQNLTYEVPEKRILHDINLNIEKGQIVSVMGQSGSGKTTLLKIMSGLRQPTSGKVLIDDTDIAALTEYELDKIRLKIGMVFQYAALFDSLTVYENIAFGVRRHQKRVKKKELDTLVRDLLQDVKLEGIEDRLPAELSGGMQKRVGLARALATNPSIVFYDEPTSGLDPVTANAIDELIMETREKFGVTSVVVSHHLPSIFRISDHVAMLHQGEIVALDTPANIQSNSNPIVQEFIHPEQTSHKSP